MAAVGHISFLVIWSGHKFKIFRQLNTKALLTKKEFYISFFIHDMTEIIPVIKGHNLTH